MLAFPLDPVFVRVVFVHRVRGSNPLGTSFFGGCTGKTKEHHPAPKKDIPSKKKIPQLVKPRGVSMSIFCRPGMWLRSRAICSRPRCLQWHSALNELFRPQLAWQTLAILQHLSVWKEPHVSSNKFHAWRAQDFASACALAR